MLDIVSIFTKGGRVLWQNELNAVEGQPIDHLIQQVLLEERQSHTQFNYGDHQMKWCFDNELGLVFVACYLNISQMTGVDDILQSIRYEFCEEYKDELKAHNYRDVYDFDGTYNHVVDHFERSQKKGARKPQDKKQQQQQQQQAEVPELSTDLSAPESTDLSPEDREALRLSKIAELRNRANKPKTPASPAAALSNTPVSTKKPKKVATKWDDSVLNKNEAAALDLSENSSTQAIQDKFKRDVESTIASHGAAPAVGDKYWDAEEEESVKTNTPDESSSGMWGFFKGLVGQKELTAEDLKPVAKTFSDQLIQKNVAPEIAATLVDSVVSGLVGRKLGTFATMHATIKADLEAALNRVLTPKKPVDVLTGVAQAQEQNRPYSIVFCGVNGVGKSTSLSKIAAFFISQGLKVGVAACDTFRSGAIEQLKTHCAALNIPLYDKGYGKDESSVAADGIINAKKDRLDVILIDTAGRMQGNDALMKGLAKLMNNNNPDLILFVGEALVGNDGCDQLINFNRALANNSGKEHPRLIDGIVLTKFDTVDDKVGAAISMTYSTGQPIVFVGTGQTYRDLKKPNAKMLINALFK